MFWPTLLVVLIGHVGASIICSDFATYQDRTYYTKLIPSHCKGKHGEVNGYRPTYQISKRYDKCPGGWLEYSGHCYIDSELSGRGDENFMNHERACNTMNAHIWVPNTREEYLWVEKNVMKHDTWYWTGVFCSGGRTQNLSEVYLVTGEDMHEINKNLNARMENNHWIHNNDHNCAKSHRNNNDWRWKWHHQNCNDRRRAVCEALM